MRDMILHRLVFCFIMSILGGFSSMADDSKITGRVLYMNDSTAVVGATVRLQSADYNTTISSTTTNESGRFSLTNTTNKPSNGLSRSATGKG